MTIDWCYMMWRPKASQKAQKDLQANLTHMLSWESTDLTFAGGDVLWVFQGQSQQYFLTWYIMLKIQCIFIKKDFFLFLFSLIEMHHILCIIIVRVRANLDWLRKFGKTKQNCIIIKTLFIIVNHLHVLCVCNVTVYIQEHKYRGIRNMVRYFIQLLNYNVIHSLFIWTPSI